MWLADGWEDYEVIDTSGGEKLERWGDYILVRPDPQVIWDTPHDSPEWKRKNAHYHRSSKGGGNWEFFDLPEQWDIEYRLAACRGDNSDNGSGKKTGGRLLRFHLKPFQFKHTGLFPEQAVNWEWMADRIIRSGRAGVQGNGRFNVMNLFAYTGGATLACAACGAAVTHVDAAKGMVTWAKENAANSGLAEAPIRYLVDDCMKFVEREIRRGRRYDGIVMDPPSYGRGPKGEVWKLEERVFELICRSAELLSESASFFLINSYTTGLQPAVLKYMLETAIKSHRGGVVEADEIGLPVRESGLVLPCGASGRWEG
ncbi:MAG: class I SAM-dependent methyltransferase [Eubacterium sp.]|nr:class I SAM-dependent methyltransferase [Eubacterium sp.]